MSHRASRHFRGSETNPATDEAIPPVESAAQGSARRSVLLGLGASVIGGIAAVGAAQPAQAAPVAAAAALGIKPEVVDTVVDLAGEKAKTGELREVLGYHAPGDVAGLSYRGVKTSDAAANGGTIVAGAAGTAWLLQHDGVVGFHHFGILDAAVPADDALDAMVNDPAVRRIIARSDLNFVRRHKLTRSNLDFDFGGHLMTTDGIENAGKDDPFAAVLSFTGTRTDRVHVANLSADMPDLADVFEVGDASFFEVGGWYATEVNALSGRWERELQRLVRVTRIIDGTHIRVDYKIGWPLAAGRQITWTKIEPVDRVRVENLRFLGTGTDEFTGSHPLAFEYAVHCDVRDVHAVGSFWPVVMRRWNSYYETVGCSLTNPTSVTWGGAGYLTQQIYCLYGYVANCHTSNARHLNDFTASAYSLVENCHGDGDDEGPFVTHGQYEHDLTYTGNSGLMTFANSGAAWGSAAKRITVRKHVCSWFVARVRITDLTLEDVQVIGKASLAGSGMLWINADGAQLRGCSADGTFLITQSSDASLRPTVIEGSRFRFTAANDVTNATVTETVTFRDVVFDGMSGQKFLGAGGLVFDGCRLTGADAAADVVVASRDVRFAGSTARGISFVAQTGEGQEIAVVAGSRLDGAGAAGAQVRRAGSGQLSLLLADSTLETDAADGTLVALDGGVNTYRAVGVRFAGGRLALAAAAFGDGSTLVQTGCVEAGVKRAEFPEESDRIVVTGNAIV
ncbi:peptidase C14 [Agromyces sp. PvR057]|uniref:peptidase C14 n=1 Tax=Agromyces sp. PvR057 TaxID=3156403 RepID=UPI000E390899